MTRAFLIESIRMLAIVAVCSTSVVPRLWAEPIPVTSGRFTVGHDNPTYFEFYGPDGFVLRGIFLHTISSPQDTCRLGCRPGTAVSMSAVAGGERWLSPMPSESLLPQFTLGWSTGAIIDGTEVVPVGGLAVDSPWMTGTFRFDAPTVVVESLEEHNPGNRIVPFVFSGQVRGFARDDLDGRIPLFDLALVGQGTAVLQFEGYDFANGTWEEVVAEYTFAPVPEPTTLMLLGSGVIGIAGREWRRRRRRHS
jgi:hypothetical protein